MSYYTQLDFSILKPGAYARKSSESEDKQMLSLVSQDEENKRIAEYYKLPPFQEKYQEAKSAKKEFTRPLFTRMMEQIDRGEIDSIVCWKLDRLARNMTEGGRIIDAISSGKIKAILTHDKVYYPSDNVLLMAVEFGQGKQFLKDLSVNVKRGQTKKATLGVPHGVATLGFLNDKTEEKGNRRWLVDKPRFDAISILFQEYLTGTYSAGKLHRYAVDVLKLTTVKRKRIGGALIEHSRIYPILRDPIYAGFFYQGGIRYELDPSLPRIITEEQHEKVKMLISKKNIPKTQKHTGAYSGFITSDTGNFIGQDVKCQLICDCKKKFAYRSKDVCPCCGSDIEQLRNPKYLFYTFYYNVHKKKAKVPYKSISEARVNKKLATFFDENLNFSPDLVAWSKKYIHEMKDNEIVRDAVISERKTERKNELQEKRAKTRAMLRDEKITQAEYDEDIKRLESEYADVHAQKTGKVDWYARLMEITDITAGVSQVLNGDDAASKRNILSSLGSNLIWDDKNLTIINTKEVDALIAGIKRVKAEYPKFEPKNYRVNKGQNEKTGDFSPAFSSLLPG